MEGLVLELPASAGLAAAMAGLLFLLIIGGFTLGIRADRQRAAREQAEPARKAA